ncbi:MAG: hypothetical protein R3E46_12260 [Sedimenticolaceae bacterium]
MTPPPDGGPVEVEGAGRHIDEVGRLDEMLQLVDEGPDQHQASMFSTDGASWLIELLTPPTATFWMCGLSAEDGDDLVGIAGTSSAFRA